MRGIVVSLFGLLNVLASCMLHDACVEQSRFSVRGCEMMRLVGLLTVFVVLRRELSKSSEDVLPLVFTTVLTVVVAMARPTLKDA